MDSPVQANVQSFVEEMEKLHVSDVVRVCESKYDESVFKTKGIEVHNWEFDDGSPPPNEVLESWFRLLKSRCNNGKSGDEQNPIAVHCVAGYGRAPVLVAVALMELGMNCPDAVELIRSKRPRALNAKQLQYLSEYRPKKRLRQGKKKCILM